MVFLENDVIFFKSKPRLGTRKINGGRKFLEIKVQKKLSYNVRNRLKFAKICRKDLLCTKM